MQPYPLIQAACYGLAVVSDGTPLLRVEQQLQPSHAVDEWTSTASSFGEVQQVVSWITWNHALLSPLVPLSASIAVWSAFWGVTLGPGCNFVDGSSAAAEASMSICALCSCIVAWKVSRQRLQYT
jgi:hypothetical protein